MSGTWLLTFTPSGKQKALLKTRRNLDAPRCHNLGVPQKRETSKHIILRSSERLSEVGLPNTCSPPPIKVSDPPVRRVFRALEEGLPMEHSPKTLAGSAPSVKAGVFASPVTQLLSPSESQSRSSVSAASTGQASAASARSVIREGRGRPAGVLMGSDGFFGIRFVGWEASASG